MVRRIRLVLLLLLAAGALWLLVDRLLVSEEERVEQAWEQARDAVQDETLGPLAALLTSDFSWSGPSPVGSGERDAVGPRFAAFWEQAEAVALLPRGKSEITVAGGLATLRRPVLLRFTYAQQLVAYRMDLVLTFDRAPTGWALAQVEVTSLRPGIL